MWSTPTKQEDIPVLAIAALAITQFVTDPRGFVYSDEDEVGRPRTAIAMNQVLPLSIELPGEGKTVVVTVECRQLRPEDAMADMQNYIDTMSIGNKKLCNFCQKPKSLLKGEGDKLLACSRCKSILYCSKQCQTRDWKRHKKECRPVGK